MALLFVAAEPLRRADVAETLRISPARLEQASRLVRTEPPYGLVLVEDGERLGLVSAPDCAAVVERHLKVPAYEALSQAALESLGVVVYSQPSRAPTFATSAASTATRRSRRSCPVA